MKRYLIAVLITALVLCVLCEALLIASRKRMEKGLICLAAACQEEGPEALQGYMDSLLRAGTEKEDLLAGLAAAEKLESADYPFEAFMSRLWPEKVKAAYAAPVAAAFACVVAFLIADGAVRVRKKARLEARVNAALSGEERFRPENEEERQLARLFSEVDRLTRLREKAAQEQRVYVENVAHELKTPASGIVLNLDLIEQNGVTPERLSSLRSCALRIGSYVTGLLSLARIRAGKVSFTFETVDTGELANEIFEELKANGVTVGVSGEGAVVNGDRVRLREAVQNLLLNAFKHSQSSVPVELSLVSTEKETAFRVVSRGSSFDPDMVIERYSVGEEDGVSSGIGLSLAQAVAARHSGKLELRNTQDGAEAWLRIP
ncbi:MAG: HAMP domain-containing histidine kinase, partial [Clostridia bacterium]|nr:HAMP domain-containing histidine kinase [Clostridia bacterium]